MCDTNTYSNDNSIPYMEQTEKYVLHTYNRFPVVFESGDGVKLKDVNGKEYLDFGAGIAVFALGYGCREYNDALKNQVDALNTSTTPATGITGVTGAVCGKIAMISLTSLATITAGTASGSVIGQFSEDYYPAAVVDFRTSMATNIRLRINTSGQLLLGEDATANITPRGSVTYITAS